MKKKLLLTSQLLLSILCLTHLFVMLTYICGRSLGIFIFPCAVFSSFILHFLLSTYLKIPRIQLFSAIVTCIAVIIFSLLFSWFYFDFSWDGQWYHQAAVYNLSEGWNPFLDPTILPDKSNNPSILHFPKTAWYFSASLLSLFNTVEMGKSFNIIVLFTAMGVVYNFFRDETLSVKKSVMFTLLMLLNPVVWSEITTYLNDGNLYLFIVIYTVSIISWLKNHKKEYILIAIMGACCLVNTKFTGLVFFLTVSFFLLIYTIFREQEKIRSFILIHISTLSLAVLVFGFNPYLTNLLHRGHPLYPIMGTKTYPSVFADGKDDNESYETPQNMKGKNTAMRLFYATFSRPGNAPYNHEDGAELINPFKIDIKSWSAYQYHETRLAGFGPYFGILSLLILATLPIVLAKQKLLRLPVILFYSALIACLCFSKHFWWPRFLPMLWLVPIIPLFIFWKQESTETEPFCSPLRVYYSRIMAFFILINGLIVLAVHMKWETESSVKLRNILTEIRDGEHSIEVDYGWFRHSVEGKLKNWKIIFTPISLKGKDAQKLPSVVKGYPNQVLYRKK